MRIHWSLLTVLCSAAAVGCLVGCGASKESAATRHDVHDGHDHSVNVHPQTGPHGGQLVELGEEQYHAEIVHDEKKHRVSVFILDGTGKTPVATTAADLAINIGGIQNPQQFKLPAITQAGEVQGMASLFQLDDEGLCKNLDDPAARAELRIEILGKQYRGVVAGAERHQH